MDYNSKELRLIKQNLAQWVSRGMYFYAVFFEDDSAFSVGQQLGNSGEACSAEGEVSADSKTLEGFMQQDVNELLDHHQIQPA
ncbi:hypothetical protein [Deinococcus roseus]|uniref:Uncharacterized protein n=1 Tax=Deinococcus roseus TaxID=392414 RepID=A0ABQ2CU10_9DEIO|nr:hypothetical protein [Deinococcus roseus]GGJ20391.1 hypothetical protein GCM10008938_03290 [Deinococcus roseus]